MVQSIENFIYKKNHISTPTSKCPGIHPQDNNVTIYGKRLNKAILYLHQEVAPTCELFAFTNQL